MQQTKTRLQAPEIKTEADIRTSHTKWRIKNIVYILATAAIAVAFLTHIYLPVHEPEVVEASQKIGNNNLLITKHRDSLVDLTMAYKEGKMSQEIFFLEIDKHIGLLKILEANKKTLELSYSQVYSNASVFGFPSRHKFIWNFGIALIICALAIEILVSANAINVPNGIKKAKTFFGITAGTIGGYFMTWIFFPQTDLPHYTYIYIMIAIGFLASLSAYYFIKLKADNLNKMRNYVKYLTDIVVVKARQHAKDDDTYVREVIIPTVDKLDEQT